MAKRIRMPSMVDLDERGLVTIQVTDENGKSKIRKATPVDARELILNECGTLDIEGDVVDHDRQKIIHMNIFKELGLERLRELCTDNNISYRGKPSNLLAKLLVEAGVNPDDVYEESDDE